MIEETESKDSQQPSMFQHLMSDDSSGEKKESSPEKEVDVEVIEEVESPSADSQTLNQTFNKRMMNILAEWKTSSQSRRSSSPPKTKEDFLVKFQEEVERLDRISLQQTYGHKLNKEDFDISKVRWASPIKVGTNLVQSYLNNSIITPSSSMYYSYSA